MTHAFPTRRSSYLRPTRRRVRAGGRVTAAILIADALANPVNTAILERLPELGVEQPWLVAGCVYGAAWNRLSGRPPGENVKDYDVFYWDEDTAWEAEDAVIRRAAALFADLRVPVELKNQKRVPIWYRSDEH